MVDGVLGSHSGRVGRFFQLVGKRYTLQLLPVVEGLVGELGNGRVHASLLTEHTAARVGTRLVQAFKKGVAAVLQSDLSQDRVGDGSFFGTLLSDGRKLLVVAHQYELVDGVMWLVTSREDTNQVGFQYLRGLVDECQLEMFQREEVEATAERGRRTHEDTGAVDFLPDVGQLGAVGQAVLQQVRYETLVARQFAADADKRGFLSNAGVEEHAADLIHRPVGVRQEQDGRIQFAQGFFHHVAQGTRSLSGTRRAYQQKVIFGLFLFPDEFVETAVFAVQGDFLLFQFGGTYA